MMQCNSNENDAPDTTPDTVTMLIPGSASIIEARNHSAGDTISPIIDNVDVRIGRTSRRLPRYMHGSIPIIAPKSSENSRPHTGNCEPFIQKVLSAI